MAQWHTIESARDEWPDAPVDYEDGGDDILTTLLAVAKQAVLAFAPALTSTAPEPVTLTDATTTVDLVGMSGVVQATVTTQGAVAATVVVPEAWRPAGAPEQNVDLNNRAYFTVGNPAILDIVTNAAQEFVMLWTPAAAFPADEIPDGYRQAQLMQARNVWNSSKASPTGDFDGTSYGLTSYPLDWQVRQLLRPKRGVPVLG